MPEVLEHVQMLSPRVVWNDEARDFTPWLASDKGRAALKQWLGLSLTDVKTEVPVGPFSADLVANLEGSEDDIVVIENQLEDTDHEHLGKLLTYASTLGAKVAVWIAARFLTEHRAALDWLNDLSEGEIVFYGLEVVPLKIGDSSLGVMFRTVSSPGESTRPGYVRERPWKDGGGDDWHHTSDENYPENIPMLDSVTGGMNRDNRIRVSWDQRLYIKLLGPNGREVRLFAGTKKGRLDISFMHTSREAIEAMLAPLNLQLPVMPEPHVYTDSPWIGATTNAQWDGVNTAIVRWLTEEVAH